MKNYTDIDNKFISNLSYLSITDEASFGISCEYDNPKSFGKNINDMIKYIVENYRVCYTENDNNVYYIHKFNIEDFDIKNSYVEFDEYHWSNFYLIIPTNKGQVKLRFEDSRDKVTFFKEFGLTMKDLLDNIQ